MRFFERRHVNRALFEGIARKDSRVRESIGARTQGIRRAARRNRVLLVTLLAVGALVAVLTGIGSATFGFWVPEIKTDLGNAPQPRFGMASAFDPVNDEMVIFGGFGAKGTSLTANLDETYAFKGAVSRWVNRNPVHHPSPRGYASMAYDGARKNMVLFGGAPYASTAPFGETWTWDGKDWTLHNPPEPRPQPRQNAVMAYDAHRKVVVLFGGLGSEGTTPVAFNDTWIWDGSRWQIMPSAGAPSPRHSAAMAYDACRGQAVMFGGVRHPLPPSGSFAPESSETWIWDGTKWGDATPEPPGISPTPRIGASMAYSSRTGHVLLYGGLHTADTGHSTVATYEHLWTWDGAAWRAQIGNPAGAATNTCCNLRVTPGTSPPPRAYASWAFDSNRSRSFEYGGGIYLFGGTPTVDVFRGSVFSGRLPQMPLGDQWGFQEPGWDVTSDTRFIADATQGPFGCPNPVPIPADGSAPVGGATGPEAQKVEVREGMREVAQLPVLLGTDWPQSQRNTHVWAGGNKYNPNPNYTPPPDCPNRSSDGSAPDQWATSGNTEIGSNTQLVTDSKRNRVYQFFSCDDNRGRDAQNQLNPFSRKLLMEAYDGTTLKRVGRVILPETKLVELRHDADRGHFLIYSAFYVPQTNSSVSQVVVVDQDLIEEGTDPVVKRIPVGFPSNGTFFNHPTTGRPKLLFLKSLTTLAQWDIEDGREDWNVALAGCTAASAKGMRVGDRVYASCALTSGDAARYAVVRVPVVEDSTTPAGEKAGTPEVFSGPYGVIGTWGDPQAERMVLLSVTKGGFSLWVFDGRVSRYVGLAGLYTVPGLGGFITYRAGLDQTTGRFYFHIHDAKVSLGGRTAKDRGGVRIVDTRLTPAPQAFHFPQFSFIPAVPVASLAPAPNRSGRVFLRQAAGSMNKYPDGETVTMQNEMFYRVLADDVPIPEQADIGDLDALTIPVPEVPGKTEVSFDAEGGGYGIRLRSVGGVWSALRPPQQMYDGMGSINGDTLPDLAPYLLPSCLFPDRELVMGWVPQARLSELDALARSSGLEVDSNSKADLQGPLSRCTPTMTPADLPPSGALVFNTLWPLKDMLLYKGNTAAGSGRFEAGEDADGTTQSLGTPIGPVPFVTSGRDKDGNPTLRFDAPTSLAWNNHFKEVECVGDALATNEAAVGNIYGSANCVQKQGLVEATARGSATGSGPLAEEASKRGFSVAEGYSTVTIARDPEKGIVVTSTAVARGIQLPGTTVGDRTVASLSIDRVETKAVAWSNGRPSDPLENPRTIFTRTICGVHTPDGSIPGCLTAAQQQTMVDNWNKGWGINSKMILPKPDPDFYQGSPGGYIAGVIKPAADEAEDQIFAKDYQREVPGLVIEFYKNTLTQGPAKQSLMLAAVRAVAGLGVQCNPDLVYSPSVNDCLALPDDLLEEEFFEDEEEEFFEDEEVELDGEWVPVEALGAPGESLGSRIGRVIQNLPVIRQLPIRQMGEALLAASVWVLLGLPLLFAWRRLSLNVP